MTFLLHYGFLFPLEEDSADMYFSESPPGDHIDLGLLDIAALCPLAITTRIGNSSYQSDVVQTIVLMPGGYDEKGEFLIDPDSLKDEDGRNSTLGTRTNGQKEAIIVHVNSGMIMGIALRCYDSSSLVYAGFKNFSDAVNSGNNFLSLRGLPEELEGYPENPTEIMEVQTEESLTDFRGCTDVKKENIRISVCPASTGVYYNLRVYINEKYRITLYKPCNTIVQGSNLRPGCRTLDCLWIPCKGGTDLNQRVDVPVSFPRSGIDWERGTRFSRLFSAGKRIY